MSQPLPIEKLEELSTKELENEFYKAIGAEYDISDSTYNNYINALIDLGVNINGSGNGLSPILFAVFKNSIKAIELLIKNSVDIESRDTYLYETPLIMATRKKYVDAVKLLLAAGADLNAQDRFNTTPLHYAASARRNDLVELFLKLGAPKDVKDTDGKTPWDLASSSMKKHIPQLNPAYNG